jgi:methyl-accepting chemotaxis protein
MTMMMNSLTSQRSCRTMMSFANTVSRPGGFVPQRGHSQIVNVSRGYKATLFFKHQNQSPGIVSVHGKGTTTNNFPESNVATVFARGKADVSHERELVDVQMKAFGDRLADVGTNFGKRLDDFGQTLDHLGTNFGNRLDDFATRLVSNDRIVVLMVGLVGLTLKMFLDLNNKIDVKVDKLSEDLNKVNDKLSEDLNKVNDKLSEDLNKKIDEVSNMLSEDLNKKIDEVNDKLSEDLSEELNNLSKELSKEIHALGAKIDQGNSQSRKLWPW